MKTRLLYLVTEDWFFLSHRLPLAQAAKAQGYEIIIVTRVDQGGQDILNQGFTLIPVEFSRSHGKPVRDLLTLFSIIKIYYQQKPDLVHHVALKPVVYGTIAAILTRVPVTINALTGLGFVFSSSNKKARLLRLVIKPVLKWFLSRKSAWLIVQNPDDQQLLINEKMVAKQQLVLIKGSGVDTDIYYPDKKQNDVLTIMLTGRMLRDKGIIEFVEAAKIIRQSYPEVRFVLVGDIDTENPSSLSREELTGWNDAGIVEWLGYRKDIPELLRTADIVCLPSFYGEGVPKSLIEAAACGKALIASDMPGCREIVRQNENGLLVPVKDASALAEAIKTLIDDEDLRLNMGLKGRDIVEQEFTTGMVISKTLELYQRALTNQSA